MKILSFLLILAALSVGTPRAQAAGSGYNTDADVETLLNYGAIEAYRRNQIGTQIVRKSIRHMRATYNFTVLGGTSGSSYNLKDLDGKDAILPNKAIITSVMLDTITAPAGAGGYIAFGANTTTDLKASTAIASYTGVIAGEPVHTAATAVKLTAKRTLTATIAGATLTAGKVHAFIEYYLSE